MTVSLPNEHGRATATIRHYGEIKIAICRCKIVKGVNQGRLLSRATKTAPQPTVQKLKKAGICSKIE